MKQHLSVSISLSRIQKTHTEIGRSMLEILAVLAILAIIAIIGILGYRYAMNKSLANEILHDAYLAYTSMYNNKDDEMDWTPVNFTPKCGKPIDVSRDEDGDMYVRVQQIEQAVCQQILLMAVPGKLMFYDEEGEDMTTCEEDNSIVVAFDGLRAPGPNCEGGDDCSEFGDNVYCNMNKGVCRICDKEGYIISPDNDACWQVCDEETETVCIKERDHWCCPKTLLCGEKVDECIESDGYCEYSLGQQTKEVESNCSYSYKNQTTTRASNCSYTASGTNENFVLTPQKGCPSGQYCYLAYKNEDCSTTLGAEGATTMYGTCTALSMSNAECRIKTISTDMLTVREGCPSGQYCYLAYKNEDCSTALGAEGAAIMYGTCTALSMSNAECRVQSMSTDMLTVIEGCPSGQYCYLAYKNKDCSTALGAEGATTMYGTCTALSMSNAECRIKSIDTNILNPIKPCPEVSYCYLKYAQPDCKNEVGATGANPFYGVCLPKNSNKVVCPVKNE